MENILPFKYTNIFLSHCEWYWLISIWYHDQRLLSFPAYFHQMDILQIWFFLKHPVCIKMRLTEKRIFLQKRDRSNVRFKTHLSNFFEIISTLSSKALHLLYLSSFIYIFFFFLYFTVHAGVSQKEVRRSNSVYRTKPSENSPQLAISAFARGVVNVLLFSSRDLVNARTRTERWKRKKRVERSCQRR